MKTKALTVVAVAALVLAGCGQTTASRSLSGGAMVSPVSSALGAIGGNAALGAAVGAGAGLLGGYLYDQQQKGNVDF